MPDPVPVGGAVGPSAYLLVLSLVVPVTGMLLAFAAGGRQAERIALLAAPLGLAASVAIASALTRTDGPIVYFLGGWAPPLGVALRADGASGVMILITAIVVCGVTLFARGDLRTPAGVDEAREPFAFWILLLGVWGALDMVFLAGDLFALYVALELLTFAAVPLVCLDGRTETLAAALRYLLFTLPGSILYLLGALLLYAATGTLDNELLSQRLEPEPATLVGAALMTVGLLAKTALFPLQIWLPPAHAGARPAASAVLSALVVKGPWFIVLRLWLDVFRGLPGPAATQLLAALGAAAIVMSSVLALRQARLKLVIAYSTLAQIGTLFLVFPLALAGSGPLPCGGALAGGLLQAISHATAKAAMFMAAGLLYAGLGHDRIAGLGGSARALPVTVLAFALGGVALIGLPPSGAYLAKDLLLQAAGETQQWWWTLVIQAGGFLTSSYLVLVLAHALGPADAPIHLRARVSRGRELAVLALALCSLLLGLAPWEALLPLPAGGAPASFSLDALWKGLGPVAGGAVIAILLGRWGDRPLGAALGATVAASLAPARRGAVAVGSAFERVDEVLQQWPAAGLAMLALTIALGAAMLAGR
jgi:formate hydrogenlyase subunit 3/multisubunit Na+/H+ antiporter MnhD subunit